MNTHKKLYKAIKLVNRIYQEDENIFSKFFDDTDANIYRDALGAFNRELVASRPSAEEKTLSFSGSLYLMNEDAIDDLVSFLYYINCLLDDSFTMRTKVELLKMVRKYESELLTECTQRMAWYRNDLDDLSASIKNKLI